MAAKGEPGARVPVELSAGPAPAGQAGPEFDAKAFFGALHTRALGAVLLAAGDLPSTQTLLQDNAPLIPDGTVAVADRQVSGKGTPTLGAAVGLWPHPHSVSATLALSYKPGWSGGTGGTGAFTRLPVCHRLGCS